MTIYVPTSFLYLSNAQDTIDPLKILDCIHIPANSLLVVIDVKALYNSIPHQRGIGVVEGFISQRDTSAEPYNQFCSWSAVISFISQCIHVPKLPLPPDTGGSNGD